MTEPARSWAYPTEGAYPDIGVNRLEELDDVVVPNDLRTDRTDEEEEYR